ncbi:recombinase family protein [Streptomyces sp. NPDC046928]|uniref:recombinase family protein n=1 Tax=Streptomyces sp. NPDC046928 TaxID=3155021 RepID=UPI0033F4021F
MAEPIPLPISRPSLSEPIPERPRAVAVLRLSNLTRATTSPGRQRAVIQSCADRLGYALIAEAVDFNVSARTTTPFERPSLATWLRSPDDYDAVVWSHVDRATRSVANMTKLIAWGRQNDRTLVFATPDEKGPLVVSPGTNDATIRRCLRLARIAEQEANTLSARLTSSHEALRAAGRYGGGLVPFGYRKAPHPSGIGWALAPDLEAAAIVHTIVDEVRSGLSLVAIARKLNDASVPVPRDRHAQLQGRPMGGRRHGRHFERFRWTAGTLCKVLHSPSLMGHRVHNGQTVRDAAGLPVMIGLPLLTADEFRTLQDTLRTPSNGSHPKSRPTALLTGVVHCAACGGRMYFAARKNKPYGDYACRATARGELCASPAGMRSDWLEDYTVDHYLRTVGPTAPVSRADLLRHGVRVTVSKRARDEALAGRTGPDTSRLTFTAAASHADAQPR